jgi:hypothetical protein
MNDRGKIVSSCDEMGHKLITSPGIADTYTFVMNTWNTQPDSSQHRVYNNTLAIVECQIQQTEKQSPDVVISVDSEHVENAILLDYLTSEVALEVPEIGSSDPKILIDNTCTDDELHFGMPGGSGDFEDEGDACDAIPTTSWQRRAVTEHERFELGTSDVDCYVGEDGEDIDADKVE